MLRANANIQSFVYVLDIMIESAKAAENVVLNWEAYQKFPKILPEIGNKRWSGVPVHFSKKLNPHKTLKQSPCSVSQTCLQN